MIGTILYLSTTFAFSPLLNLATFPVALLLIILRRSTVSLMPRQITGIVILLISTFASTVIFVSYRQTINNFDKSLVGAFPYLILIIMAIFLATLLRPQDLRWILYLVIIEIFVSVIESIYGVRSFFVPSLGEVAFGTTNYLYYNRVYGLSDSSSVFAFKVLIGWICFLYGSHRYSCYMRYFICTVLLAGLYFSFNRSVILSLLVAIFIYLRNKYKTLMVVLIAGGLAMLRFWGWLATQASRGIDGIDYSGRDVIFSQFLGIITENPLVGNGGAKVWIYIGDSLFHAHNSFLELGASIGIPLSIFWIIGYLLLVWRAWPILIPFIVYSSLQYGLFWGFVFNDIVITAICLIYIRGLKSKNNLL